MTICSDFDKVYMKLWSDITFDIVYTDSIMNLIFNVSEELYEYIIIFLSSAQVIHIDFLWLIKIPKILP